MKRVHEWNLQSILPCCAPQVLSTSRGRAGQGLFSAGRGGVFPLKECHLPSSHLLSNQSSTLTNHPQTWAYSALLCPQSLEKEQKWHFSTVFANSVPKIAVDVHCWGVNVQKRANSRLRAGGLVKLYLLSKGAGGRRKIRSFRFLPFIQPPSSAPAFTSLFWCSSSNNLNCLLFIYMLKDGHLTPSQKQLLSDYDLWQAAPNTVNLQKWGGVTPLQVQPDRLYLWFVHWHCDTDCWDTLWH